MEGNAPIVELSFTTASGAVRKARFLVDTGGGGFLIGSKLMADIGAKATGPAVEEEGERFQPLAPFPAKLGAMNLDLAGVRFFGLPDSAQSSPQKKCRRTTTSRTAPQVRGGIRLSGTPVHARKTR